ncbi:unnamed protein product [Rhizophagus irregularis]|nr:unnamed protein product [Rhizophagus irregularis]
MSTQFFSRLSKNYIEILDDEEYNDITIEVGKDPNVKIFRAHMIILCYRSPFFRRIFASNKKNDSLAHIKLPNISPKLFQTILRYIYGELVNYLQEYLIKNKSEWIKQNFEITLQTSFQASSLLELQQFCVDFMAKSPEKVFNSLDFTLLPEKSLVSLIKRDDLQMKEIEIWEHVLKWSLEKNPTLISDPVTWSDDDFEVMKNTLQHCLPLIRFFSLSSEEFVQKVRPYKKLLRSQLYEEFLNSYLNPNSEPNDDILLPRYRNIDGIIDSKIVNLNIVSLISRWIDKLDIKSKFAYAREFYLPYRFRLLLRGSRDGYTPKRFHELCDNIPHTVTFIRVSGTGEILGGYNPLIWRYSNTFDGEFGKTKDSFIFSFKSKDNFKDSILSHVKCISKSLFYCDGYGPTFNLDLCLMVNNNNDLREYNICQCKQTCYEKKIRNEEYFRGNEYEVYQIIMKEA